MPRKRVLRPALLLALAVASQASGQAAADSAAGGAFLRIGSVAEERLRDDQLRGAQPTEGFLLRTPSSATRWDGAAVRLLAPEAATTWNSRIPYSSNDGALWGGAGLNVL